jgi:hypothetical protein
MSGFFTFSFDFHICPCMLTRAHATRIHAVAQCPDKDHPVYSTSLGMYEEGCGLDKLMFSWGHDEYFYQVRYLALQVVPTWVLTPTTECTTPSSRLRYTVVI